MGWDVFRETYYRPHLLVIHPSATADPGTTEQMVVRLAASLRFTGDYAVKSQGPRINVAFELASDMNSLARMIGAGSSVREPEWASRSTARLTRRVGQRIARHLEGIAQDEPSWKQDYR